MNNSRRTTFSFDQTVNAKLADLAKRQGTTKTEILRRAITLYDYLDSQRGGDGHIKIEKPGGDKVELLLP